MPLKLEDSLEYRFAQQRIDDFSDAVMEDHYEAMRCMDCEETLQIGISAYEWLSRFEDTVRDAICQGLIEWSDEAESAFRSLFAAWLRPCETVDQFISDVLQTGHRPENLDRFEEVRSLALDKVERDQWALSTRKSRQRAMANEPW